MRLDDLPTSDRVEDRRGIPEGRAGLGIERSYGERSRICFHGAPFHARKALAQPSAEASGESACEEPGERHRDEDAMRPPTALPATHSPSSGDVGTSRIEEQLLVPSVVRGQLVDQTVGLFSTAIAGHLRLIPTS